MLYTLDKFIGMVTRDCPAGEKLEIEVDGKSQTNVVHNPTNSWVQPPTFSPLRPTVYLGVWPAAAREANP